MTEQTITVTDVADLATALSSLPATRGSWRVVGQGQSGPDAPLPDVLVHLAGRLADVVAVGGGLVDVGGGVTLPVLAQSLQAHLGVAPGLPLHEPLTVGGLLVTAGSLSPVARAVRVAMSDALVEVEVHRTSTSATEVWSRDLLWQHDDEVGLPDDAVVVRATFRLADVGCTGAAV